MTAVDVSVFENEPGDWWAECLICREWVSTGNATRREAQERFGRHLQHEPHPPRS